MRKYRGITLIGMLLTMATVIIAGIVVMRIVPVYLENYEVSHSIKALNTLPATEFSADTAANAEVLRSKLLYQLYINGIEYITPEQITIVPNGENKFTVTIKYRVIKSLVANASLLFIFNTSQEVTVRVE